jgi:hypothetical protein
VVVDEHQSGSCGHGIAIVKVISVPSPR